MPADGNCSLASIEVRLRGRLTPVSAEAIHDYHLRRKQGNSTLNAPLRTHACLDSNTISGVFTEQRHGTPVAAHLRLKQGTRPCNNFSTSNIQTHPLLIFVLVGRFMAGDIVFAGGQGTRRQRGNGTGRGEPFAVALFQGFQKSSGGNYGTTIVVDFCAFGEVWKQKRYIPGI